MLFHHPANPFGLGHHERYQHELTLMRFNIFTLISLCALAAFYLAYHQSHIVFSLCAASFCVAAYSLTNAVRQRRTSLASLAATGSLAACIGMLAFGLLTLGAYGLEMAVTDSWPDEQDVYVSYELSLILFVVIYGGGAAMLGGLVGLITYAGVQLVLPHEQQSLQDRG